jgi:hypothetical protein
MMMMLKTRADFIKRSRADNRVIAAANTRMEKEIRRLYKNYLAQAKALIKDPSNFTKSKMFDLAVVQKTTDDLKKLLEEAGRDDVIGSMIDELTPITVQARSYFEQFGDVPELGGASEEAFNAYIDFSENRMKTMLDAKLVEPMQSAVFQVTFGNMDRSTVIDTVESISENLTPYQAATLVDDTFRQYQRGVTNMTAEELGLDIFRYTGPDDEITSEQCEFILNDDPHGVPGMYYRDEIHVGMHEKLKDDPFVAGGHPNCRHKFYPITREVAESEGFK